jgi:hypothetical protein
MNQLDDELRDALRRQAPPPDLAERVIARTRALDGHRAPVRRQPWAWALATAAALAFSLAPLAYMRHVRARQGEQAKEQALLALRVTAESLRGVQQRVAESQDRRIEIPRADARKLTDERRRP